MFKKVCSYTFLFILSIAIIFGNAETITPESAVFTAFKESGASIEEVNINSHVVLEEYITIDNIKKICNDIAESLNISDVKLDITDENGLSQAVLYGLINEEIHATLIVQSSKYGDFEESTIVLDIIDTKGEYDLQELCDKIRNVLSTFGNVKVNITLTGAYDDNLNIKDKKEIIKKLYKKINAKEVEGISDDNLVSISGYTTRVAEHLSYNDKKVNINVALRYNSFEQKTNIWIGTPVIVIEY